MYGHTDLAYAVPPTEAIPDLSSFPKLSQLCCIPSEMGRLKPHSASKTQEHGGFVPRHRVALFPGNSLWSFGFFDAPEQRTGAFMGPSKHWDLILECSSSARAHHLIRGVWAIFPLRITLHPVLNCCPPALPFCKTELHQQNSSFPGC